MKEHFVGGLSKEQLLNLKEEHYETTHFTNDPEYAKQLDKLRMTFDIESFME